jgi:AcrR family transcriptional regulator
MGIAERKERQKAELRDTILAAARRIFLAEGPQALTMRRIAEAIEYSPGTIYLYFTSREDIALHLVREGFEKLVAVLAPVVAAEADPVERIRAIGAAYIDFGISDPATYQLVFMEDAKYLAAALGSPSDSATSGSAGADELGASSYGGRGSSGDEDPRSRGNDGPGSSSDGPGSDRDAAGRTPPSAARRGSPSGTPGQESGIDGARRESPNGSAGAGSSEAGDSLEPGDRAFDFLTQAVAQAVASGAFARVDPEQAAQALWAGLHGALSLHITCPSMMPDVRAVAALIRESMLAGLRVRHCAFDASSRQPSDLKR